MSTKATNPKDAIAGDKLPLHLVPDTLITYTALAFLEGALKYGAHNWRAAGVRASVYRSALNRHLVKWWNGENCDPKTKVPHLANAAACIAILLDAQIAGKLTDDRPPPVDLGGIIDGLESQVKHLKALFAEHNPKHYTIADTERPEKRLERVFVTVTDSNNISFHGAPDDGAFPLHPDDKPLPTSHPLGDRLHLQGGF